MTVEADSSADLLCRMVGLFAQRDLAAPALRVDIAGQRMTVTVDLSAVEGAMAAIMAEKMARCIGVAAVTIDGVPLAYLPPTTLEPVRLAPAA
ncbi:MAG: hypothetical protein ACTHMG_01995 [Sphingomonas sp.]